MALFGTSSLYIFISLFGGITLLVFLLCICCQRKLQARTLAMAEITDIEGQRGRQGARRNQRRSDTHQLIAAVITPPPDYATVIKKDSLVPMAANEPAPPAYEVAVAVAGLRSDGYV